MNPKRILVALTLALFVSALCTWLVSRKLVPASTQQRLPDAQYASPSRTLQAGEMLKPENTELIAWPGAIPIDGAFTRTAGVIGRVVLFPLAKGQPILESDLSAPGSGTGLASKIPDGMRAVALRSDEVVGVAGFLIPGSHLDVLVTYHSSRSPEPQTATVLENALVIAAGHQIEPDPEGKKSDVAIVTLLLNPEDSQRAVLASTQGDIHFVLRNGGDSAQTNEAPMLLSQLASHPVDTGRTSTRPPAAAPTVPAKHREIEVILGGGSGAGQ
ncbi:MAG TPA: Flp pilus assembly protein CpaB [Acidobacteriaceae bacterium]